MPFDPASLKYDASGLIPCIAQDDATGEVLMMAWMNRESITRTIETGNVTYWSRSRGAFWAKGETSGHVQRLVELRIDCDRDCLLARVTQEGPASAGEGYPRQRLDRTGRWPCAASAADGLPVGHGG